MRLCNSRLPEEQFVWDNPQVQGIIVAISKGGSDKYGVSNPQGAKGKINILSSPICHWYDSTYTEHLLPTRNEK